jgi:RNA polymerase sigma-B factor
MSASILEQSNRITLKERNALIEQHLGLVRKAANHYSKKCLEPYDDLVQVGSMGLIRAVERFQNSKKNTFSTYAMPCIKGAILQHLRDRSHTIRIPRPWHERYQAVCRRQNLINALGQGGEASLDLIAQSMGIDTLTWSETKSAMQGYLLELDEEIYETVSDPATPYNFIEKQELREAISHLEPLAALCIELVFWEDLSYRQVSKQLKIPYQQVTREVKKAIATLRTSLDAA